MEERVATFLDSTIKSLTCFPPCFCNCFDRGRYKTCFFNHTHKQLTPHKNINVVHEPVVHESVLGDVRLRETTRDQHGIGK